MNSRLSDATYANLIEDILSYDVHKITRVESAKSFAERVTALLDFMNEDKRYSAIKGRILKAPVLMKLDAELRLHRDSVLILTSDILDDLKQFLLKKGVKLVDADSVREKISTENVTNVEMVSLYLDMIRRNYVVVNTSSLYQMKEMLDYLYKLIDTVDSFGVGNPITEKRLRQFDFAVHDVNVELETYRRRQRQEGVAAFETMESIWLAYKNNNEFMASNFFLTPLGIYLGIHTEPGKGDIIKVQEDAQGVIDAAKLFNKRVGIQRLVYDDTVPSVLRSALTKGVTYFFGNLARRLADGIIGTIAGIILTTIYFHIHHNHL